MDITNHIKELYNSYKATFSDEHSQCLKIRIALWRLFTSVCWVQIRY